jgi:hypothetical protein
MAEPPRPDDWDLLGLAPDACRAEVEAAFARRQRLYAVDSVSTYTLLTEDERSALLARLHGAHERLAAALPASEPEAAPEPAEAQASLPLESVPVSPRVEQARSEVASVAPPPEPAFETTTGMAQEAPQPSREAPEPAHQISHPPPVRRFEERPKPPPEPRLSPGAYLRFHRERQEVSTAELGALTRIRPSLIAAIEEEDFDQLPAPVYVRGFVVSCARQLRLPDPEGLARHYLARMAAQRK